MADSNYEIVHNHYATEAAGIAALNSKDWAYAQDTNRQIIMDGATPRYYWDATRLADRTTSYGTAIIGTPGITGVTPSGGGSGAAATLQAMLTGLAGTGNANFIQNGTGQQASSNFNISGAGVIGTTLSVAGAVTMASTLSVTGLFQGSSYSSIGSAPASNNAFLIYGNVTGLAGVSQLSLNSQATMTSAATTAGTAFYSKLVTSAAAFTMANGYSIYIETPLIGSGSSITTNYGLFINDQIGGGTNYAIKTGAGLISLGGATTFLSTIDQKSNSQALLTLETAIANVGGAPSLIFRKARGTVGSEANVANGDDTAYFLTQSYSGGSWFSGAQISFTVDGTFTNGQRPPSRMDFYTNVANAVQTKQFSIAGSGAAQFYSTLGVTGNTQVSGTFNCDGVASVGGALGSQNGLYVGPATTTATQTGIFNDFHPGTATTNGQGLLCGFTASNSGTMTNGYHINMLAPSLGGSGITNFYGIKMADFTGATNNWAIKTGLGLVEFGDNVLVKTSTTSGQPSLGVAGKIGFGDGSGTAFTSLPSSSVMPTLYSIPFQYWTGSAWETRYLMAKAASF